MYAHCEGGRLVGLRAGQMKRKNSPLLEHYNKGGKQGYRAIRWEHLELIQLYISIVKTELMNAAKTHTTHSQLHHFTEH